MSYCILAISRSRFPQFIKNWIVLNSAQKGLLKNVQDRISRPLGSREIHKTKVYTVLLDTLYVQNMSPLPGGLQSYTLFHNWDDENSKEVIRVSPNNKITTQLQQVINPNPPFPTVQIFHLQQTRCYLLLGSDKFRWECRTWIYTSRAWLTTENI